MSENKFQHTHVLRLLAWPISFGFSVICICLTTLIVSGTLPIKRVMIENPYFSALLEKEDADNWKKLLANSLSELRGAQTLDIGMFLFINSNHRLHGRVARNLGEICFAIEFAINSMPERSAPHCSDDTFSQVQLGLAELDNIGLIEKVHYMKDAYPSYRLSSIGLPAFEELRKEWIARGSRFTKKLSLMDLEFKDIAPVVERGRQWLEGKLTTKSRSNS